MDYLIVGLGNPGREYEHTRHNIGRASLEYVAKQFGIKSIKKMKFSGLYESLKTDGNNIIFLKPQTYMNLSGKSVKECMDYYNIPLSNLLVICDDISLPVSKLRIRRKGSCGGQNGLRNIIACLGTEDFARLKIGIGDREDRTYDLADWVLGTFSASDRKLLKERMDDITDCVKLFISQNIEEAMARYN